MKIQIAKATWEEISQLVQFWEDRNKKMRLEMGLHGALLVVE